ncbi:ribonuclease-3 family protein [Lachnospiraceae bacterium]|nr:ribonuclease-3 family protein [Lachnospiraceae bacterium]
MEESRLKTYSPQTFAYLGDAVYSLFMRNRVVQRGNCPAKKLHKATIVYVSANAQEAAIDGLLSVLTEEERDIYERGKNTRVETHAKNASLKTYHKATGMECLVGWLYLKGDKERLEELLTRAAEINEAALEQ